MDRCVTCQYFDRQARGADRSANTGQCRRSGPSLSPLNQKSYMIEGVWPTVRDDDWCGEWKALVRRVDPARLGDVRGTPAPAGTPRMPGVAPPLPHPRPAASLAAADPLATTLPGFAASARAND